MKLNTERIHTIWHLTWPQCIMLLCQFVIGITDVWAGGRIGSEVQGIHRPDHPVPYDVHGSGDGLP